MSVGRSEGYERWIDALASTYMALLALERVEPIILADAELARKYAITSHNFPYVDHKEQLVRRLVRIATSPHDMEGDGQA